MDRLIRQIRELESWQTTTRSDKQYNRLEAQIAELYKKLWLTFVFG